MIKRALVILFSILLLSSCAVYTSREGYQRISIPETTGYPSTKYAVIHKNYFVDEYNMYEQRRAEVHSITHERILDRLVKKEYIFQERPDSI